MTQSQHLQLFLLWKLEGARERRGEAGGGCGLLSGNSGWGFWRSLVGDRSDFWCRVRTGQQSREGPLVEGAFN